MGPVGSGSKSRAVPRSALVSETASHHKGRRPRAAASPTRTPMGGFVIASGGRGAQTIVTPDPSAIDGLLARSSGLGGGVLLDFGPVAGAECCPF